LRRRHDDPGVDLDCGLRRGRRHGSADGVAERHPATGRNAGLDPKPNAHQATIAVDEKGTIAAAVTADEGGRGGVGDGPPPETTFHIDHPFLYFIRDDAGAAILGDNASGTILFMGRIDDPSLKS
jgi:hypothetical protein